MFSYSTGNYVSPPIDQYLKFKNRCSLCASQEAYIVQVNTRMLNVSILLLRAWSAWA